MLKSLVLAISLLPVIGMQACCNSKEIPKYTKMLYSTEPKTRNQAALSLARCGELAAPAVTRLIELMYDQNVGVQSSSAYALRKIDTHAARSAIEKVEQSRRRSR